MVITLSQRGNNCVHVNIVWFLITKRVSGEVFPYCTCDSSFHTRRERKVGKYVLERKALLKRPRSNSEKSHQSYCNLKLFCLYKSATFSKHRGVFWRILKRFWKVVFMCDVCNRKLATSEFEKSATCIGAFKTWHVLPADGAEFSK